MLSLQEIPAPALASESHKNEAAPLPFGEELAAALATEPQKSKPTVSIHGVLYSSRMVMSTRKRYLS
jgi:hypothetical protein